MKRSPPSRGTHNGTKGGENKYWALISCDTVYKVTSTVVRDQAGGNRPSGSSRPGCIIESSFSRTIVLQITSMGNLGEK